MNSQPHVVRFNDVSATYWELKAEIEAAIAEVLRRGDFIGGRALGEFEADFARYCGAAHCVGVANGTCALHVALEALGIGPGDEVITSPMTFIATAEAITHTGAKVVFADIDAETWNLDPKAVSAAITPRTRAVIFVHLHGNPSGLLEVAELCQKAHLALIEDCAQAHGAQVEKNGERRHVGTFGALGCFSFFPAKNLGAFGDAGAVVTSDAALAAMVRQLVNHGREDKYRHLRVGYNYRLDTLQAAILRAKLPALDSHVEQRNRLCDFYEARLSTLDVRFQRMTVAGRHGRHLFAICHPARDALQQHLRSCHIETGIHYPIPLHLQPAYAHLGLPEGTFPIAEELARTTLSLPLYAQLPMSDVERVCDVIEEFVQRV
ncbi:MAG: glutamine--scyllo-inositol aminotransferase [Candidatus Sumerlaea sp.]|uniref:UDP-4-amino-4-deoxy-L-arabinose--oxoglutarate aminotransferase n=1 Tax=Sumerlaea chitinivorans TaxID=2250252 RepID=A0A2Z4Y1R8_SUMC1|nr:UDP-4-amino-4-deoxy-L-arabinose--oxoglutarate aminotransferase [Candidatus Sumerlaea chitinivorans]GIX45140.1 MAG: glutamine--scyllo-inositol aminotransferase [Candidatus Sumerlaea sp.]